MSNFDAASFNPGMQITLRFAAGYLRSLILLDRKCIKLIQVVFKHVAKVLIFNFSNFFIKKSHKIRFPTLIQVFVWYLIVLDPKPVQSGTLAVGQEMPYVRT